MKRIYFLILFVFSFFIISCDNKEQVVTDIEIYKSFDTCYDFEDVTLIVSFTPSNAVGEVLWESSDDNILTIDASGKVTFTGSGTVTVKATLKGNNEINDSFTFEVIKYIAPHDCEGGEWEFDQIYNCGSTGTQVKKCIVCDKIMESRQKLFGHKFITEEHAPTCEESGISISI